jgi:hypothetical protein
MRFFPWLRPSVTGLILFALLVALQSCLGSSGGSGSVGPVGVYQTSSYRSMGLPPSVILTSTTQADGATASRVEVHWPTLLLMGGLTYCLATAAAQLILRKGRRRHPARILLSAIGATMVLAFLAAVIVSKGLWGYYLYRPPLDRRIGDARKVISVTSVSTAPVGAERALVANADYSIDQLIDYGRTNDYYSLGERALIALRDRGRLPTTPPTMSPERLARLYGVLARTGWLEAGELGYEHAKDLRGVVIEAEGDDGGPLLFVGVQGGEVSNDHYPYYEFIYSGRSAGGDPILLSAQRFYFDVAGIEGMEWPVFFVGFTAMGLVLSVPATLLGWPSGQPVRGCPPGRELRSFRRPRIPKGPGRREKPIRNESFRAPPVKYERDEPTRRLAWLK